MRHPLLIFCEPNGQLGNRLQLSAYAMAFSFETQMKLSLLHLSEYAMFYEGCRCNPFCIPEAPHYRYYLKSIDKATPNIQKLVFRFSRRINNCYYLKQLLKIQTLQSSAEVPIFLSNDLIDNALSHSRIIFCKGHYFIYDQQAVYKHKKAITRFFRPREKLVAQAEKLIKEVRRKYHILVGVHIRRGDYRQYQGGIHYFTDEQYREVVLSIGKQIGSQNVCFLVCSNEFTSDIIFQGLNWVRAPGTAISDLYVLSKCDYIVGPRSSFNRWAAFIGEKYRYEMKQGVNNISLDDFVLHKYLWP